MAKRWCVNFDIEPVLRHGLAKAMWLMQYQYAHGRYDYQGHRAQIARTSANLNILQEIRAGDWFAAYLPNRVFYAIGEVIEPRDRQPHHAALHHTDTIERTVGQHSHQFLTGVVQYTDAPMLYEDFTDAWRCPGPQGVKNQPSAWEYPQRIDVREWEYVIPDGVQVPGLAKVVAFPTYRLAAFEIPKKFFQAIATKLRTAAGGGGLQASIRGRLPEEVEETATLVEGAVHEVTINAYERNPKARRRCLEAHGTSCCICGFSFGARYGEVAEGYIHVHHLRPLSEIGGSYVVDPEADLRPICPNCRW